MGRLSTDERARLLYYWPFWARLNQLPPAGDWLTWLILAGRGFGKRLAVDTPIPTPDGWKFNGDIVAGDTVFDQSGKPIKVLVAHEADIPAEMYRVHFSDGSHIDADAEHLWTVVTHADRKSLRRNGRSLAELGGDWWRHVSLGPQTTKELIAILQYGKRGDLSLCIPTAQSLDLPNKELSIDPWVLGYWLGNGSCNEITAGSHKGDFDADHVVSKIPFAVTRTDMPAKGQSRLYLSVKNFVAPAVKEIPEMYLRASHAQRLALLQGLMDSDGYAGGSSVEFCTTLEPLAYQVAELATTLGQKPILSTGRVKLRGRDFGPKYRVTWRPTLDVFTLPRKLANVKILGSQADRNHHRMITAIEPVEPRLSRCLTVDGPSALYLAGRAMIPTHNTRAGSEWIKSIVQGRTPLAAGTHSRIAIVAETAADVRDVIVEGESGILRNSHRDFRPRYEPSKRRLTWPNGAVALLFNGTEPDQLRGPQHDAAWIDELAKYRYAQETWDMLQFGLRLGDPRQLITTTPRPMALLKEIIKNPTTKITRGSTYDNRDNLAEKFFQSVVDKYSGTRLGRQELEAEILEDLPGAFWTLAQLDAMRVNKLPDLERIVIAIDPSGSSKNGDEVGIIAAGVDRLKHGYVFADSSNQYQPREWAAAAIRLYHLYEADCIVAESNFGGGMVEATIRSVDPNVPVKLVHASRGKSVRAEPIAALYEQRRVFHAGTFPDLEDQMCAMAAHGFTGRGSPDRLDAMVWALTMLMLDDKSPKARIF